MDGGDADDACLYSLWFVVGCDLLDFCEYALDFVTVVSLVALHRYDGDLSVLGYESGVCEGVLDVCHASYFAEFVGEVCGVALHGGRGYRCWSVFVVCCFYFDRECVEVESLVS